MAWIQSHTDCRLIHLIKLGVLALRGLERAQDQEMQMIVICTKPESWWYTVYFKQLKDIKYFHYKERINVWVDRVTIYVHVCLWWWEPRSEPPSYWAMDLPQNCFHSRYLFCSYLSVCLIELGCFVDFILRQGFNLLALMLWFSYFNLWALG